MPLAPWVIEFILTPKEKKHVQEVFVAGAYRSTVSHDAAHDTNVCQWPSEERDKRLTAKAKADVAAFGIGPEARVSVKLRQGKKLKGYISQAGEDSFVITDSKTGSTTSIAYADVAEVQRQKGLSTGAAILVGVGVTFGVLFLIGIIATQGHR